MADMTSTQAFSHAPASTEKTALLVDIDALLAELSTTQSAGAISQQAHDQLRSGLIDWVERLASEMAHHT